MRHALLTALALTALPVAANAAPPSPAVAGALIGPALFVSDVTRSLRFYIDGLGFKVGMQMGPPARRETILTFGGDPRSAGIILLSDMTAQAPITIDHGHGYDRTVLRLADLDATAASLRGAGFAPSPIRDVAKGYRMMTVTDPDGYKYELVESASQPAGAK